MAFKWFKRGSDGGAGGAATIVITIMVILVLYIAILPPEEQQRLLNGTEENVTEEDNEVILKEVPGRIETSGTSNRVYSNFQGVDLRSYVEGVVLLERGETNVRNNVFNDASQAFYFSIDELKNTNNYILTYSARDSKGDLLVYVNNNLVYKGNLLSPNPIEIPREYIKEENVVVFSSEGPSWRFWKNNEFNMYRVKITADKKDTSQQEVNRYFFVGEQEREKFKEVKLSFDVECLGEQDILSVDLNGKEVYSEVPVCSDIKVVEVDVNETLAGRNELVFKSEEGRYSIDRIRVNTNFKKPENTMYFFDLTEKQMNRLEKDNLYLMLYFESIDNELYLHINNHKAYVETDNPRYKFLLNKWVMQGENTLLFDPERSVDISLVEVQFE